MSILNIAPTKSALLALKKQLGTAEEGYDLLDQKRQILVFELLNCLRRATEIEERVDRTLASAQAELRAATLEAGSLALDRAALAIPANHQVDISNVYLMGVALPHVSARLAEPGLPFGIGGTPAGTDGAMTGFTAVIPELNRLAELQNAVARLADELRKTQRRCNALRKIFIPNYRHTIKYITATLEERERENFVMLGMIRQRNVNG